jgi:16S rRNA (cytosine1402-N4)-methyltransferase
VRGVPSQPGKAATPRGGALCGVVAEHDPRHTPVLADPVRELVAVSSGEVVLDATVGLGGHARMFAEAVGESGTLIGLDVDDRNLAIAEAELSGFGCRVELRRENFAEAGSVLEDLGIGRVDVVFADLGVSSTQLDEPMRGFSFRHDGPLDMRMDDRLNGTATDLVNGMREKPLADLIFKYSQERFSRRIAKGLCYARREKRITRTSELAEIVCRSLRVDPKSRHSKIHPATRVFQALRIAVNDELGALERLLERAPGWMNPGGRIGVLAFHSLEDGMVKRDFRARKSDGVYEILTKRPVVAEPGERDENPRSRSAKLRAAKRIGASGEA